MRQIGDIGVVLVSYPPWYIQHWITFDHGHRSAPPPHGYWTTIESWDGLSRALPYLYTSINPIDSATIPLGATVPLWGPWRNRTSHAQNAFVIRRKLKRLRFEGIQVPTHSDRESHTHL